MYTDYKQTKHQKDNSQVSQTCDQRKIERKHSSTQIKI